MSSLYVSVRNESRAASNDDERDKPITVSLGLSGDVYARAHVSIPEARRALEMLQKAIARAEERAAEDREEAELRAELAARKAAKYAPAEPPVLTMAAE